MKCLLTAALAWVVLTMPATASPLPSLLPKKDPPKYTPKVTTLVAWAVCQERQADNPELNSSQRQNILDVARSYYQKAIAVDANHVPAYTGLARVYMNMDHYDKAQETYHKILQKFPKNASLWLEVGVCHCRAKQWELAVRSFQKAGELDPESRTAIETLGFCQARAGHLQESLQTLSKVMSPAEANFTVARMLHHMNRDDLCRGYLRQALQLNPDLAGARSLQEALDQAKRPLAQIQFE